MKSSVTRTELLAFWYWMLIESRPSRSMSNPASRSTRALCSSWALHQMKSWTSGWSTLSTTILAARRVLPPDLMVLAEASAPRMNDTGPEASPPWPSCSLDDRMVDRLDARPRAALEDHASSTYQLRIDGMVSETDRMKQLWTRTLLERYSPLLILDVVDGLHPTVFDGDDLLAERRAGLAVQLQRGVQRRCLSGRQEPDLGSERRLLWSAC